MRLHAQPKHPDYRSDLAAFDVRLNGVMVEKGSVLFADEEAGLVDLIVRDLGGTPLQFGAEILTETKRGKVEIIRRTALTPVADDSHNTRSRVLDLNRGQS